MKNIKSLVNFTLAATVLATFACESAAQGVMVNNPTMMSTTESNQIANYAEYVQQVAHLVTQIKNQVTQIKALTSQNNLGNLANSDSFRQALPADFTTAYDTLRSSGILNGSAGAQSVLQSIGGTSCSTSATGSTNGVSNGQICQALQMATPQNISFLQDALKTYQNRGQQLSQLISGVNNTQDQKSSSDLNARINGEIASLLNENAMIQTAYYQNLEQEKLTRQQRAQTQQKNFGNALSKGQF